MQRRDGFKKQWERRGHLYKILEVTKSQKRRTAWGLPVAEEWLGGREVGVATKVQPEGPFLIIFIYLFIYCS